MTVVPEPRIESLCGIYQPKKITRASIELVDTPGLSRDQQGNASRLAIIREATSLVVVVAAFDDSNPVSDLQSFAEDLALADMEIVSGRLERIEASLKKPIPKAERESLEFERDTLLTVNAGLEKGTPIRENEMSEEQRKTTRAFRLFSEKPRLVVVNTADDEADPSRFAALATDDVPVFAVPVGLELELERMTPEDRKEFEEEMGVGGADRDGLIRAMLKSSGYHLFFTAGDKEVRTWLLRSGGTALEAADGIHSDLARGFIRAEVMTVSDLLRLGSERDVKAANLMRQEPRDYVVGEDDILHIRFSV